MQNDSFATDLVQRIQSSILNQINKAEFLNTSWQGPKFPISQEFLEECFQAIDHIKLKEQIVARLESEAVDKIVNKFISEYSNDIKSIMSNKDLREDLRASLKSKIKAMRDLLAEETNARCDNE